MTAYDVNVKLYDNCIIGYGTSNAVTIYTEVVEEVRSKIITVVSNNVTVTDGKQDEITKALTDADKKPGLVDLCRTQREFKVTGFIDSADFPKLRANFIGGTGNSSNKFTVPFYWALIANATQTAQCVIKEYSVKKDSKEQDELQVHISLIEVTLL